MCCRQKDEPATKPKGRCHERLYGEALKRFDRMDTKAKAPLADCTFTPSIGVRTIFDHGNGFIGQGG
jgi:hypothetical protein